MLLKMIKPISLLIFASCILAIMPVNAYDFTLSVYGNANMDDIIDECDIEYLQGIIDGDYEETEFADANYDGQIDEEDLDYIESIISGDKVKLTLVDNRGVTVSLDVPVNRVAASFLGALRPVVHIGAIDRIVGMGSKFKTMPNNVVELQAHPELKDLPGIGSTAEPSQEAIVSLNLDVVLGTGHTDKDVSQAISHNTGTPFVYANPVGDSFKTEEGAFETWRILGLILGNEDRENAEELIRYCDEKIGVIEEVISDVPEDERPRVYLSSCCNPDLTSTSKFYEPINIAGGVNVAESLGPDDWPTDWWGHVEVSKEQIIDWNPDVILINSNSKENNYVTVNEILSYPAYQTVNAVKNERVYGTKGWYGGWDPATGLCECLYMAKLFYPDKFEDLDVEKECNAILEEFYDTPQLYDWMLENCGEYYTWK